ncbi:Transmembrane protein 14C [Channa argus]|uniref:Transmembrane protein 14C n=1 Tax=Channa argus TaxID=215402 RepID=A0A6G1Q8P4_CHAAH|nr:Transmembrane protein 14C [Channa argus]
MAVDWVGFGYAALVSAGGIIGYVKAGRLASSAMIGPFISKPSQWRLDDTVIIDNRSIDQHSPPATVPSFPSASHQALVTTISTSRTAVLSTSN